MTDDLDALTAAATAAAAPSSSDPRWHDAEEKFVVRIAELSSGWSWMHNLARMLQSERKTRYQVPIIILTAVSSSLNFIQSDVTSAIPEVYRSWYPVGVGVLNMVSALLASLQQFYRVTELEEQHMSSALQFSRLARELRAELSLPYEDRDGSGGDFVRKIRKEYDAIVEAAPQVPLKIAKKYTRLTKKVANLSVPEVLSVSTWYHEVFSDWTNNMAADGATDADAVSLENGTMGCCATRSSVETQKKRILARANSNAAAAAAEFTEPDVDVDADAANAH